MARNVLQNMYNINTNEVGVGEPGFKCWGVRGLGLVLFVLCDYIWNAPAILLLLLAFDYTGSLGYLPRRVVYPSGSTLGE